MPTGESPGGNISYSTHVYSIRLWVATYMQREASSFSAMADGSHDLFLMDTRAPSSLEAHLVFSTDSVRSKKICSGVVLPPRPAH